MLMNVMVLEIHLKTTQNVKYYWLSSYFILMQKKEIVAVEDRA